MLRRFYILIAIAACAVALGAAGCGGAHRTASHRGDKRTVLVDASLGLGAFRRFIWIPARAGKFAASVPETVNQGAAAAHFASRELRVAARQVQSSKRLQLLFAPLELTADKISALANALQQRSSRAKINALNGVLTRIAATAQDNGARIIEAPASKIAAAGGPRA